MKLDNNLQEQRAGAEVLAEAGTNPKCDDTSPLKVGETSEQYSHRHVDPFMIPGIRLGVLDIY